MEPVKIVDDTLRANKIELKRGYVLRVTDSQGRQIQDRVEIEKTFDEPYLENTIKRAKRWMRSKRWRSGATTPKHLAVAMAVFHKTDPKGFNKLARGSKFYVEEKDE